MQWCVVLICSTNKLNASAPVQVTLWVYAKTNDIHGSLKKDSSSPVPIFNTSSKHCICSLGESVWWGENSGTLSWMWDLVTVIQVHLNSVPHMCKLKPVGFHCARSHSETAARSHFFCQTQLELRMMAIWRVILYQRQCVVRYILYTSTLLGPVHWR